MTEHLGPGPIYRSETSSSAAPVAAKGGGDFGATNLARPIAGLVTIVAIAAVVGLAVALFSSAFTKTVPVTLISQRAGLVMNTDAKVKMRGVQVGKVDSIEQRPDGMAVLHLAMDPDQMHLIPDNVRADIASSTVFGAKYVELRVPEQPSSTPIQAGKVLQGDHVTVEMNTVFQQLTDVLNKLDPAKLNQTLAAMSTAVSGRGEQFGQTMVDFDALLAKLNPSLQNFGHDMKQLAPVSRAYADAAPELLQTVKNTNRISDTLVSQQKSLDNFLVNLTGLADTGNDVLGGNREQLSNVLHLLTPTTDLLREYAPGLKCALAGMNFMAHQPPQMNPGVVVNVAFTLGIDRYRYPANLPKVAAKGGPQCMGLPYIGFGNRSKYLVTDTGANPWAYGNQGILLNSDGLKQLLFGPIDGPPRNTTQAGMPG
ncbi:MCE family protein [Mycobacterium sp. OTB74]|uniref:MCE family protein n=1 Tax=Mycobacterium sp. OTB74 TaxID=1853452 RepID=UPI002475DCE7|nr:MCE family protein [Mycobacterium sp. OTB74]MDH6245333.1 phospholipid/cholesterol/gamma-HCH transport system substrate-binding protein [Mycobacterium sp. OTB74]